MFVKDNSETLIIIVFLSLFFTKVKLEIKLIEVNVVEAFVDVKRIVDVNNTLLAID